MLLPTGIGELLRLRRWKAACILAGVAAVTLAVYFAAYHRPEHHPTLLNALRDPARAALFFLTFMGSAVATVTTAAALGAVTTVALCVGLFRHWSERFACLLAGFVMLVGVATTLARSGLGAQAALAGRYAIYHELAWVLIYLFALLSAR